MAEVIGFIGAGRMGSALMQGFVNAKLVSKVMAYDTDQEKLNSLKKKGVTPARDNKNLVQESDTIILAVKPQNMEKLLDEIKDNSNDKLFISIAAGVTTKKLEAKLKGCVVRVMPNTPCTIYQGITAIAPGGRATKEDMEKVKKLFNTVGTTIQVEEKQMDAVTGLSGSGPAYTYYMVKALAEAGVEEGLSEEEALKLAAQTVKGAAEMLLKTGKKPEQLIDEVCSPRGTTIEGMKILEDKKVAEAFKEAVNAAARRSRELSR